MHLIYIEDQRILYILSKYPTDAIVYRAFISLTDLILLAGLLDNFPCCECRPLDGAFSCVWV